MSPHALEAHVLEASDIVANIKLCKKCLTDGSSAPALSEAKRTVFKQKLLNKDFVDEDVCEANNGNRNMQSEIALTKLASLLGVNIADHNTTPDIVWTTLKTKFWKLLGNMLSKKATVVAHDFLCTHPIEAVACAAALGLGELLRRFYLQRLGREPQALQAPAHLAAVQELNRYVECEQASGVQGGMDEAHDSEDHCGYYDLRSGLLRYRRR